MTKSQKHLSNLTYKTLVVRRPFKLSDASLQLFKNLSLGRRRLNRLRRTHVRVRIWCRVIWRANYCLVVGFRHRINFNRRRRFLGAVRDERENKLDFKSLEKLAVGRTFSSSRVSR